MTAIRIDRLEFEPPSAARRRIARDVLGEALDAGGALVSVRGLSGSGVSTMLRRFVAAAVAADVEVAEVRLDPVERELRLSTIDRVYFDAGWLRERSPVLDDRVAPLEVARALVADTLAAPEARRLLVVDGIEHSDEASAAVLRYAVPRLIRRDTVVVVGDRLSTPSALAEHFAALAAQDASGRLLVLPELDADDIAEHVLDRAQRCIDLGLAELIRRRTGGRFAAVDAFVAALDLDRSTGGRMIRALPRTTHARTRPRDPGIIAALPARSRLTAEACALSPDGVGAGAYLELAAAHGIDDLAAAPADGVIVEWNPLTGTLHLVDPLAADDLLALADPDRLRRLHLLLAGEGEGADADAHRVAGGPALDLDAATALADRAREAALHGDLDDALRLLEAGLGRAADDAAARRLLLTLARLRLRFRRPDGAPAIAAETFGAAGADPDADPGVEHVIVHRRIEHARNGAEAAALRADYLAPEPRDLDHEFLQSDIAVLGVVDALLRFCDEDDTEAVVDAVADARRRLERLVGRVPADPELAWLEASPRLVLVDALRTVWEARTGRIAGAAAVAAAATHLAERAAELPAGAPEQADVLALAAGLRAEIGDLEGAATLVVAADEAVAKALRPIALPGVLLAVAVDTAMRRGEWAAARERIGAAEARGGAAIDLPAAMVRRCFAALLDGHAGEVERAAALLPAAEAVDVGVGFALYAPELPVLIAAELRWYRAGAAAALEVLDRPCSGREPLVSPRISALRIELLAQLDRCDELRAEAERYAELAEARLLDPGAMGDLVAAHVGLVGGDADRAVDSALRVLARAESPALAARAQLIVAKVAAGRAGEQAEAIDRIHEARRAFASIGAIASVRRCERAIAAQLAAHSERCASLTEREHEVAELAAAGAKNREIAAALHISEATVAFHMTNVLAKLRVRGRGELASALELARTGASEAEAAAPADGAARPFAETW